jgi:hypothetical protein
MSGRGVIAVLLLSLPLVACTGELTPTQGGISGDGDGDGDGGAETPEEAAFSANVQPILNGGACFGCHVDGGVGGNLFNSLADARNGILTNTTPMGGTPVVSSPAADSSLLVEGDHIDPAGNDSGLSGGRAFTPDEIATIIDWIDLEIAAGNVAP